MPQAITKSIQQRVKAAVVRYLRGQSVLVGTDVRDGSDRRERKLPTLVEVVIWDTTANEGDTGTGILTDLALIVGVTTQITIDPTGGSAWEHSESAVAALTASGALTYLNAGLGDWQINRIRFASSDEDIDQPGQTVVSTTLNVYAART